MATLLDPRMVDGSVSLSVTDATITNLQTTTNASDSMLVNNLTAVNNIITNFYVLSTNVDRTFTEEDNSKVFHFDTNATPLTATFPNTLPNGFNVGIMNMGTKTIFIESTPPLNAFSSENSTQYTGMFIYKANDEFFGIGVFE